MSHPMEEAAHLRKMYQDAVAEHEATATSDEPDEPDKLLKDIRNLSVGVLIGIHPLLYTALLFEFSRGLERGYLRGRAMAAYEVRMGMDEVVLNGSVHYDSDTEAPPEWLVGRAEKLARGNT